jgi:non-canonical (house-cleaning) NTP pyrophosphatase
MPFEILLGSTSNIKKEAVENGFGFNMSSLMTIDSRSGVPSQPVGKEQTKLGAYNRAIDAIKTPPLLLITPLESKMVCCREMVRVVIPAG